jgi:hypothetical protein
MIETKHFFLLYIIVVVSLLKFKCTKQTQKYMLYLTWIIFQKSQWMYFMSRMPDSHSFLWWSLHRWRLKSKCLFLHFKSSPKLRNEMCLAEDLWIFEIRTYVEENWISFQLSIISTQFIQIYEKSINNKIFDQLCDQMKTFPVKFLKITSSLIFLEMQVIHQFQSPNCSTLFLEIFIPFPA